MGGDVFLPFLRFLGAGTDSGSPGCCEGCQSHRCGKDILRFNNYIYIYIYLSIYLSIYLVGGDWNMTFSFFHSVGNVIIPIGELIFVQRGWNHQPVYIYIHIRLHTYIYICITETYWKHSWYFISHKYNRLPEAMSANVLVRHAA